MKKKHAILPLLATAVLSSCQNYGQEITSDTARVKELEQAISVKTKEVNNYEATISTSIVQTNADALEFKYQSNLLYQADEKGSFYLSASVNYNEVKSELTMYAVDNEKYGKVVYSEVNNITAKESYTEVYAIDDEEYSSCGTIVPSILMLPLEAFLDFRDPLYYAEMFKESYPFSTKYYSKGDGNLTIEMSQTTYEGDLNGKQYFKMAYDNYLLSYAKIESSRSSGAIHEKQTYEINSKALSNFSITLPSDWEERMSQAGQ